ncbi:manganese-dependent inorganic pyrophosphatase [Deinococcus roseus]|uniref:inorganic diphosphatase n=1 Tax=Deinococcus roseus TaxID=392414 RepID=A0ABQ2DEL7_9DEIO|nr:manganese-dependent inorganic pyrophosphatase [Deinococcus roseus]GGJ54147.1 putative manganese-dependent inorganic pyrophosphatase [Deinococcus roseus]
MTLPVFGHTNPDTDAITSALVYASLLSRLGTEAKAYRLGDLNNETSFVLKNAGVEVPELLESLPEGTEVALVDHNESGQSLAGLSSLKVTRVVDHHKLGDLTSKDPLYLRFEPVGCTGTILGKLYRESNLPIEGWEARLMLSAILSDTLHFRSPTTTDTDREMGVYLAQIAGVSDIKAYALEMFAAKSDLGDTPADKLLKLDYKVFPFGGKKYGLGVMETTNPGYALGRKAEILAAMQQEKDAQNLEGVFFSVVDILEETNQTFVLDDAHAETIKGVFGADTQENVADLGNRISRKKQIVPAFEKHLG